MRKKPWSTGGKHSKEPKVFLSLIYSKMRNKVKIPVIKVFIRRFINILRRMNMDRKELLAGLINKIGVITVNSFVERLAAQKIIFIAQNKMKDFPTNYRYGLYISGPYSAFLARDLYEIKDTSKYGRVKFKDLEQEKRFLNYADVMRPYLSNQNILELIGTLVYLEKHGYSGDSLFQKLKEIKSGFDDRQYKESMKLFNKINLVFNG